MIIEGIVVTGVSFVTGYFFQYNHTQVLPIAISTGTIKNLLSGGGADGCVFTGGVWV